MLKNSSYQTRLAFNISISFEVSALNNFLNDELQALQANARVALKVFRLSLVVLAELARSQVGLLNYLKELIA